MKKQETGKIFIIPEQYAMLQSEYEKALKEDQAQVEEIRRKRSETQDNFDSYHVAYDDFDKTQRTYTLETLRAHKRILANFTLVDTYSQDVIDIGTRFQVLTKSPNESGVEDFILIHKRVANEPMDLFVSCDTAFGILLKGHKVGDVVQYKDNAGNLCTVEVLKIYANRLGEEIETEKLR